MSATAICTFIPQKSGACNRTHTISSPATTLSSISVINLKSNSKIYTKNKNIINLVRIIESEELSLKQMMGFKKLKDRKNFVEYHLKPALNEKFVRRKYPDRPRHPRQKYLLTVKGLALYNALMKEE